MLKLSKYKATTQITRVFRPKAQYPCRFPEIDPEFWHTCSMSPYSAVDLFLFFGRIFGSPKTQIPPPKAKSGEKKEKTLVNGSARAHRTRVRRFRVYHQKTAWPWMLNKIGAIRLNQRVKEKEVTYETAYKKHWWQHLLLEKSRTCVLEWDTLHWTKHTSHFYHIPCRCWLFILEIYKLCSHKLRHRDTTSLRNKGSRLCIVIRQAQHVEVWGGKREENNIRNA